MSDQIEKVITGVIAAVIGVVMIGSVFVPIALKQVDFVAGLESANIDVGALVTLLGMVITLTILGVVIAVLRNYTGSGKGDR